MQLKVRAHDSNRVESDVERDILLYISGAPAINLSTGDLQGLEASYFGFGRINTFSLYIRMGIKRSYANIYRGRETFGMKPI